MPKNVETVVEPTETVETPVAQTTIEVTDTFTVEEARVNIRGDEKEQSRYNLLVTDPAAIEMLEALGKEYGFQAANDNGQHYVSVTMDGKSVMEMRRGGGGFKNLLVTGELTIIDIDANKRPQGHLTIFPGGVQKASLMKGGIVKARTTTKEVPISNRPTLASNGGTGLRSVRR